MLKLNKSFSDFVTKGKQRWLLLFLSFWSLKVVFIHIDWPFISDQLFILLRSITAITLHTFPFKTDFLTLFNSLQVTNICSVLFFIEAGNNKPRGVILYIIFFYFFFNAFRILTSSVSICIRFSLPTMSKFCWALTMIVLISYCISSFLFLPSLVMEKL